MALRPRAQPQPQEPQGRSVLESQRNRAWHPYLTLIVGQGDGGEQSKIKNGRAGVCQKEVGGRCAQA